MTITIQREIESVWTDVTTLAISNGETVTLGFNSDFGDDYTVMIWAAGVGIIDPASVVDRQGKEIVQEGWLECKLPAEGSWTPLKFPASFPAAFADLAAVDGVYSFTATASSRTSVQFRMTHAASPTTGGEAKFVIVARWLIA
jgi:hypothetical protein